MQTITHIEVVLIDSQKLPDEFLVLSEEWKYLVGGIYSIVQTDIMRELTPAEDALLEQLKSEGKIITGARRTRVVESASSETALPDWAEP